MEVELKLKLFIESVNSCYVTLYKRSMSVSATAVRMIENARLVSERLQLYA